MYCSIVKIAKVRKSDEGTYEVVAKNREGEATNTLVLNVTDRKKGYDNADTSAPPVVVKPLTPTMCKVGDTVRMETVITGTPTPKLVWLHNGKQLKPGKKVKMREKENTYTLILDAVGIDMDGEYVVKAENKVGYVLTSANVCV